jgi:hypothetical protein
MRHRIRIQPYISPDLHRKLRAHAMAQAVTDSAVTEAALRDYLERDGVDEDLVVRRMDGVTQAVAQLQHDMDVLSQAVCLMAWRSYQTPLAAQTPEAARQAAEDYATFLGRIASRLAAGARLAGDVQRASKDTSRAPTGSGT